MRLAPAAEKPDATAPEQGEPLIMSRYPSPEPTTELATISQLQAIVPAEFFKPGGSEAVLAALFAEVRKQAAELDISTESRRAAIASLAYKVAKSKTALDKARKDLVADQKEALKAIDREGARIWDELEALQAEVRKPLTDWENAEKERIGNHEAALKLIQEAAVMPPGHTSGDVSARIAYVSQLHERPWEEFKSRADLLTGQVIIALETTLQLAKEAEAQRAELARLRAEETNRKERERIQAIRDEAAAEERRKAEALRIEQAAAAERERQRIEHERAKAEAKAKQAEAERIAAEERAAQAVRDAEARRIREAAEAEQKRIAAEKEAARVLEAERIAAKQRQHAAIEAERKRVADEAEAARLETEKRERNKKHRASIEAAAKEAFMRHCGVHVLGSEVVIEAAIAAIREGLIPNVTINY